jgi:hypothetical protein
MERQHQQPEQQQQQQRPTTTATKTTRGRRRQRAASPLLAIVAVLLCPLPATNGFIHLAPRQLQQSAAVRPSRRLPPPLLLSTTPGLPAAGGEKEQKQEQKQEQEQDSAPSTRHSRSSMHTHRRNSIGRQLLLPFLGLAAGSLMPPTTPASAAAGGRVKGAAELDAEAYIKDLLKGNPLQGAIDPSPLVIRPARTMDVGFVRFLDAITLDGIAEVAGVPRAQVEEEVGKLQRAVEPSFQRRAAFPSEDLSNEYAFDCRTYVEFRVAAKLIPNLNARAAFVQKLGSRVLDKVGGGKEGRGIGGGRSRFSSSLCVCVCVFVCSCVCVLPGGR